MSNRYTAPSIDDDLGGISIYLDKTKSEHNDNDSNNLKKYWNWGAGKHLNITALAVMFNVSWSTMDDWLNRLHIEANIPRPGKDLKIAE